MWNPLHRVSGYGVGSLKVLATGWARVTGRMPNGQPVAVNVPLDASGNLAFFAYRARFPRDIFTAGRWISGNIAFRERKGVSDADGALRWHMGHPHAYRGYSPPLRKASVEFLVSRASGASTVAAALGTNRLRVKATGGAFPTPMTADVLAEGARLYTLGSTSLQGTAAGRAGLVGGTLRPSGWTHSARFDVAIFASQRRIVGQFKAFKPQRGTGKHPHFRAMSRQPRRGEPNCGALGSAAAARGRWR